MENTPRESPECPFCYPIHSDGQNRVLRHNMHAYLTLSNPRKVPGHALVIPKRHVEKPWELRAQEITDIFELVGFAQEQILSSALGTGSQVRQNYMPYLPQGSLKVDHVHYHVLPRSLHDDLYVCADKFENDLFETLSDEERRRIEQWYLAARS